MSQVPAIDGGSRIPARATPPMTWNGTLVDAADTETYYLHLSAFPCKKCNGPVIAGSLGTRHDHISKETNVRQIGAACIACGFVPELVVEPAPEHRFRPVEWKWTIKGQAQPANPDSPSLQPEVPLEQKS
jgi:hypothetical protein